MLQLEHTTNNRHLAHPNKKNSHKLRLGRFRKIHEPCYPCCPHTRLTSVPARIYQRVNRSLTILHDCRVPPRKESILPDKQRPWPTMQKNRELVGGKRENRVVSALSEQHIPEAYGSLSLPHGFQAKKVWTYQLIYS